MFLRWQEIYTCLEELKISISDFESGLKPDPDDEAYLGTYSWCMHNLEELLKFLNPAWPVEGDQGFFYRTPKENETLLQMSVFEGMVFAYSHEFLSRFSPDRASVLSIDRLGCITKGGHFIGKYLLDEYASPFGKDSDIELSSEERSFAQWAECEADDYYLFPYLIPPVVHDSLELAISTLKQERPEVDKAYQEMKERQNPDDRQKKSEMVLQYKNKDRDERDLWIYNQVIGGIPYKNIKLDLASIAGDKGWQIIGTVQGIRDRAFKYAERMKLADPPKRN